MSDDKQQAETAADGDPKLSAPKLPLKVISQYIADLSFENPNAPNSLSYNEDTPEVRLNVNLKRRKMGERAFEILLLVKAQVVRKDMTLFLVDLTYGGLVQMSPDVEREDYLKHLMIDVPSMLFPFAREVIADVTRKGGFPPLLLTPIDFETLYDEQIAPQAEKELEELEKTGSDA